MTASTSPEASADSGAAANAVAAVATINNAVSFTGYSDGCTEESSVAPQASTEPTASDKSASSSESESAGGSAVVADCEIPGMSAQAKNNCQAILQKGLVPRNAFLFAMKGLKNNATEFKTKQCFDKKPGFDEVFDHYSTPGLDKKEDLTAKLQSGIPNKCSLIINNYDERIKTLNGFRCKAAMYYIDLCSDSPQVKESYSWVGYGTCKNNKDFTNKSDQGTSLLGFSVTASQSFNFQKRDLSYRRIATDLGGKVPAVALFGLQNSNNGSSTDLKYLHVGAYTSAGCPSIDKSNHWMIEKLAEAGPSVVVGYKEGQMEELSKCE